MYNDHFVTDVQANIGGRCSGDREGASYPHPPSFCAVEASLLSDGLALLTGGLSACEVKTQGGPVVIYDDSSLQTLVVSQLTGIKTAEMDCTKTLSLGIKGTVESIPKGYTASWLISAGTGIKQSMEAWGDVLLANGGKKRADPYGDVIRSTLG